MKERIILQDGTFDRIIFFFIPGTLVQIASLIFPTECLFTFQMNAAGLRDVLP